MQVVPFIHSVTNRVHTGKWWSYMSSIKVTVNRGNLHNTYWSIKSCIITTAPWNTLDNHVPFNLIPLYLTSMLNLTRYHLVIPLKWSHGYERLSARLHDYEFINVLGDLKPQTWCNYDATRTKYQKKNVGDYLIKIGTKMSLVIQTTYLNAFSWMKITKHIDFFSGITIGLGNV